MIDSQDKLVKDLTVYHQQTVDQKIHEEHARLTAVEEHARLTDKNIFVIFLNYRKVIIISGLILAIFLVGTFSFARYNSEKNRDTLSIEQSIEPDVVHNQSYENASKGASAVLGSEDASGTDNSLANDVPPPGVPQHVSAQPTSTEVQLSWGRVTGSTQYEITVSLNSNMFNARTLNSGIEKLTVSGLSPLKQYYVKVRAINSGGKSEWSGVTIFKTRALTTQEQTVSLPGKVNGIEIVTRSANVVTLKWANTKYATRYTVVRATNEAMTNEKKEYASTANNTYDVQDLRGGTTYYFLIRASNVRGYGSDSDIKYVKTPFLGPIITSIALLSNNALRVQFNSSGSTGPYMAQLSSIHDFSHTTQSISTKLSPANFTNLQSGTTYYARVRVANGADSVWSKVVSIRTLVQPVSGLKINKITSNTLSLSWGASRGATGYSIRYSKKSDFSGSVTKYSSDANLTIGGLSAGTTYYIQVRAHDGNRATVWSTKVVGKTVTVTKPSPSFTVASFNIFYSTAGTAYSSNYLPRLTRSTNVIKNNGIQLAGLQEVRSNQYHRILDRERLGSNYGIFPKSYNSGGYASQNPVVWDKRRFELVDGKVISGLRVGATGWQPNSNIQVKLRDKNTGKMLYLINTHETVGTTLADARSRYVGAVNRANYLNELSRHGLPILVTGDFNLHPYMPQRQPVHGNNFQNSAYCIFASRAGMRSSQDAVNGRSGCRQQRPGPVDYVFVSRGVSVLSYNPSGATPPTNGSDVHNTIIVKLQLP